MLDELFERWAGEACVQQLKISANGSNRRYFRLKGTTRQCIGVINNDVRENEAFFYFSDFFRNKGLPVPEVYAVSDDRTCYLQQDLGDTTLYDYLYDRRRNGSGFDSSTLELFKQALRDLASFQLAADGIDFSRAYPRNVFDRQSMQWDLNYFKYYFLKLAHVQFDEQLLENDFSRLMDYLLGEDYNCFMYRDFQSRNIMVADESKLFYIDFQGGRRGAPQYDVASLIYSAKSDLPEPIRQELLDYYIAVFRRKLDDAGFSDTAFRQRFYGYALLRIMQAMGAYGYRGYYERKDYFLKSIPLAVANLRRILDSHPLPVSLPHLEAVWRAIISSPLSMAEDGSNIADRLTVTVQSFSYKQGIPQDTHGNGGGHVFDCRALPNPGRYPEFRSYTGCDEPVRRFLMAEPSVSQFLSHAEAIVSQSVRKYQERKFSNLMVSFGCTGGQHRSVYCAEYIASRLREFFDCNIVLRHIEQEK